MSLIDLEKKHIKEWEEFAKLRHNEWANLVERQQQIMAAFGNEENVPPYVKARLEKEEREWRKDWDLGGRKEKDLKLSQTAEKKNYLLNKLKEPGKSKDGLDL